MGALRSVTMGTNLGGGKPDFPNFMVRPFLIVAKKTEYRDISGQFFLKSHLIVTKTRNIMEKIFRGRFCHGISADIS